MEVGCTSVFGVGRGLLGPERAVGGDGRGGEGGDGVMGCWVSLSCELLDAGPALPAADRGEHWHLRSCCNNPGKCVWSKPQPVMSVPTDGRFSTPLLK